MKTAAFVLLLGPFLMLNLADRTGIGDETAPSRSDREAVTTNPSSETDSGVPRNRDDEVQSHPQEDGVNRERFNENESRFHSSLRDTEQRLLEDCPGN